MPFKLSASFADFEQIFAIARALQAARDAGQDYDGGDANFTAKVRKVIPPRNDSDVCVTLTIGPSGCRLL